MNSRPIRVLIVDDSAGDRLLFESCIDKQVDLIQSSCVEDGLENARSTELDGILLDLRITGLDGFDFLEMIRSETKSTWPPVIVWSSSGEQNDVARAYRVGANVFVQKPKSFSEMEYLVESILRTFRMARTPRP